MSRRNSTKPPCSFDGCGRRSWAKGLCDGHYQQRRAGKELTPLYTTVRPKGTPPRIIYDEAQCPNPELIGPCHIWRGSKTPDGYGMVRGTARKQVGVHRYVWETANGPIPDGLLIDHQCRNRACCNVNHLRLVTKYVNSTENVIGICYQLMAALTHCKHGHEFTPENTHIDKYGWRCCRACGRAKQAACKRRKKQSLL